MEGLGERALSEADLSRAEKMITPPNNNSRVIKRKREDEMAGDFSIFKEEMRAMMTEMMATQLAEIMKNNTTTLSEVQQSNKHIETSVANLSSQFEEFQHKITGLENQIAEDRSYVQQLEYKIEDLQRESRKTNLEIKNVPRLPNETKEDLVNMIISLSNTVSCPITKTDIKDIYRLRPKEKHVNNTPIIVETASTFIKNDMLKMCKAHNTRNKMNLSAKHLGLRTSVDSPVFVAEQLTVRASRLYFLARELKRRKLYKHCWTSYGRVYVRKDDDSQIIQIYNEIQIERLSKENLGNTQNIATSHNDKRTSSVHVSSPTLNPAAPAATSGAWPGNSNLTTALLTRTSETGALPSVQNI